MKFILISLLILLAILFNEVSSQGNQNLQCVIYSERYQEYFYAANFMFSKKFKRAVYTFPLGIIYSLKNGRNFDFKEDDRKGVWLFEPVQGRQNVYYLKNLRYEEYLYAGDPVKLLYMMKTNYRLVHTQKNDRSNLDESFMWRLEQQNNKGSYNIYNVKYNEPLYASERLTKEDVRRDVFTWHKSADGFHFSWNIKCKDDLKIN